MGKEKHRTVVLLTLLLLGTVVVFAVLRTTSDMLLLKSARSFEVVQCPTYHLISLYDYQEEVTALLDEENLLHKNHQGDYAAISEGYAWLGRRLESLHYPECAEQLHRNYRAYFFHQQVATENLAILGFLGRPVYNYRNMLAGEEMSSARIFLRLNPKGERPVDLGRPGA